MKKLKNLKHNNFLRFVLLFVGDGAVITFYLTYLIRKFNEKYASDPLSAKIAIIMTGIFLGLAVIFYTLIMLCDFLYDESSKRIVIRCDLNKAYKYIKALRIVDVLRLYKIQYYVFLTIYYRDFHDIDNLDKLLENKIFKKDLSMELVYNYNKFIVSIEKNDALEEKKYYDILVDTYESSIGVKKEISLVYSLDMIKAEHNYFIKEYNKMFRNLSNINKEKLNHRELAYYYYMNYLYYKSVKQENKGVPLLERGRKLHPNAYFYTKN